MDQAEREKREARGANSNQPRYWIRTFPFLIFTLCSTSFLPIFRERERFLCYSATLLFSKAAMIPWNPRATNPSRSTAIIGIARENHFLSPLSFPLSFKTRAGLHDKLLFSRDVSRKLIFDLYSIVMDW